MTQPLPETFNEFATSCYVNSLAHGFWDGYPSTDTVERKSSKIALIHSEVSELLEALRKPKPHSEHIPDFTPEEEELADIMIRVGDYAARYGLRLGEAILAKMTYNASRPFKHGKTI